MRIFAINNGSKDNIPFVLKNLDNGNIVINAYPQLGVAGAWNYGLRYLFNMEKAERVLVVNQDIALLPQTYEALRDEHSLFCTAVSVGSVKEMAKYKSSSGDKRPHPDFSCYLITRQCYELVGCFDEKFYPAWFEDNDYHIRMAQSGVEAYCIDLPFYHYAAGTMKLATEYDKAHYYGPAFLKSKQRFLDKYGTLPGTKEYENMCSPSYWTSTGSSNLGGL